MVIEMNGKMPLYIAEILKKHSVDTDLIKIVLHGDLDEEENMCDVYYLLDSSMLHIVKGIEEIKPIKRSAKRITTGYAFRSYEVIPLAVIKSLKIERMISTTRLVGECNTGDDQIMIGTFSLGLTKKLELFIKAFEAVKAGNEPKVDMQDDETICPNCGMRYPEEGRKVCPNCSGKFSVSVRLFGFFKDYWKRVLAVIMVMLLSTAFNLVSPYLGTKLLFDEVLTEGGKLYAMVLGTVVVIFAVKLIGTLLGILYSYVLAKIIPWIVYDIKMKIFTAMQRLSTSYYTSKQTGSLMTRVNRDSNNIYWFFVDGLPYVIVNSLTFIGIASIMFWMSWQLALITVIAIPVVMIIFRLMWSTFRNFHHRIWVHESNLSSLVSDALGGQRVIKVFAKEDMELSRFDDHSGELAEAEMNLANVESTAFPLVYLLMFVSQVIVTAVGGVMVLDGKITIGTLLTFISYLTMLYGPLEFMSWVSNWWSRCIDSAQRVFEIIDAKPDVEESEHPVDVDSINGEIEFDNVIFEYEPARPVIKGMSIHVKPGEMLGIVGKAGAGKSTMANLMARLYDPTEGVVKIDGIDIKDMPMKLIRKNIGIVSQEIYLFIGTIADNIRYANPEATMEDVISAAKAAGAHDFIMKLPDAYETRVGAGGQDLSGGERQRLSIARTIIQNPKILILDEATAAMDTETERKVQESINDLKSGRTTIAIAHRLSTLRDADQLAVVLDGKIVEKGTHNKLLKQKGEFYKLYTIQVEALKYTGIG